MRRISLSLNLVVVVDCSISSKYVVVDAEAYVLRYRWVEVVCTYYVYLSLNLVAEGGEGMKAGYQTIIICYILNELNELLDITCLLINYMDLPTALT